MLKCSDSTFYFASQNTPAFFFSKCYACMEILLLFKHAKIVIIYERQLPKSCIANNPITVSCG